MSSVFSDDSEETLHENVMDRLRRERQKIEIDRDIDLIASGEMGWLAECGSVWSSHIDRRTLAASISSNGSLDLSTDILPIETPVGGISDILPDVSLSVDDTTATVFNSPERNSDESHLSIRSTEVICLADTSPQTTTLPTEVVDQEEVNSKIEESEALPQYTSFSWQHTGVIPGGFADEEIAVTDNSSIKTPLSTGSNAIRSPTSDQHSTYQREEINTTSDTDITKTTTAISKTSHTDPSLIEQQAVGYSYTEVINTMSPHTSTTVPLPVDNNPNPVRSHDDISSHSQVTALSFQQIQESLAKEAVTRQKLQRQLLTLEEEKNRVEIAECELRFSPLKSCDYVRLSEMRRRSKASTPKPDPPIITSVRATDKALHTESASPDRIELNHLLQDMSNAVTLLASSAGVPLCSYEESGNRDLKTSSAHYSQQQQPSITKPRVLTLPKRINNQSQNSNSRTLTIPTIPTRQSDLLTHQHHLHSESLMSVPVREPLRVMDANEQQPIHLNTDIQKQVSGCLIDKVVVTTRYETDQLPGSRSPILAAAVSPMQRVSENVNVTAGGSFGYQAKPKSDPSKAISSETQTDKKTVGIERTTVSRPPLAISDDDEEPLKGRLTKRIITPSSNTTTAVDVTKTDIPITGRSSTRSRTPRNRSTSGESRRSSRSSRSSHSVEVPHCASVQTASSRAKLHRRKEDFFDMLDVKKPPFRPTSVSPKRKRLSRAIPNHHRHKRDLHSAQLLDSLTAPTASYLQRVRSNNNRNDVQSIRVTGSSIPTANIPVPREVQAFNRHAQQFQKNMRFLGPALTA